MEKHVQQFIDYDTINRIVHGYESFPQNMLGPHEVDGGYVIVAYHPSACGMVLRVEGDKEPLEMEKVHEMGVFACFVKGKKYKKYTITKYYYDGNNQTGEDPYCFPSVITADDVYMFGNGIHYQIYEKLGAHPMTLAGVYGTYFAVWAPHAKRVSVVGNMNMWDGRVYPMRCREDMGIYELFIPHVGPGEIYKYEIMTKDGKTIMKSDPYGNSFQMRPDNASVVTDINGFDWKDAKWMKTRNESDIYKMPMNIYEVHLGSWKRKGEMQTEFMNYREIAHDLAEYCEYMGYTHVELIGISEHPFDGSWGYQVTGYYAPTSRHGDARDFMYFVDYMHQHGISVILDWVPAHFPRDAFALGRFDGEPLYEHPDTRLGEHPDWGTYIFNYGKKEVSNFLIGSALFWIDKFHIDGLRTDAVASMLYLDYGKQDGQWVANKYGGKENLEAVEFIKHLNSIVEKRQPGAMVIAEESTAWPNVTSRPEDGGLGFTYKWNMGWMNDFIEYISKDPLFRKGVHNKLTFAMAYHHSERYILVLSHDEVVHGKCSMINKQPGDMYMKFQGLRTSYGFMFGHPGKKLLFMGQDFGQLREWSEERSLDWYLLDDHMHRGMHNWVKELLHLEKNYPALYATDYTDGFQWINCDDNEKSIVTFLRKSPDGKKSLIFVCNFTPVVWDQGYRVGVPNAGTYKEILNSDDTQFGGSGQYMNGKVKAREGEWDGRPYSIPVKVPPMSCVIFEFTHKIPKTPEQKAATKTATKKTTAKKTPAKKTTTKTATAKTATAKTTTAKTTTAKTATAKTATAKTATTKTATAKTATTKTATTKTATAKTATAKTATAKTTTTKATTKATTAKAPAKTTAKKAEPAKKVEPKVEAKVEEKKVAKKAEPVKKAEPKVEAKVEEKKVEAKPVAKKAESKVTEKKAPAKKTTTKTTTKAATKKTTTAKAPDKSAEKKEIEIKTVSPVTTLKK